MSKCQLAEEQVVVVHLVVVIGTVLEVDDTAIDLDLPNDEKVYILIGPSESYFLGLIRFYSFFRSMSAWISRGFGVGPGENFSIGSDSGGSDDAGERHFNRSDGRREHSRFDMIFT